MALTDALTGLRLVFSTIKYQPASGPEKSLLCLETPPMRMDDADFPCAIFYLGNAEVKLLQAGVGIPTASDPKHYIATPVLVAEIHHARIISPQAIVSCQIWLDKVMEAVTYDATLAASVAGIVGPVKFDQTNIVYGSELHYGLRIEIPVKYHRTITS